MNGLLRDSKWIAIVGFFDPLTAAQVKRLAAASAGGCKVLAIVLTASDSMLTADARAALIAAVRGVDAVVIAGDQEWRSAIPHNAGIMILDDPEGEKKRSAEFVKFILERQGLR